MTDNNDPAPPPPATALTLRELALAAQDRDSEIAEIPQWGWTQAAGTHVIVWQLREQDRNLFDRETVKPCVEESDYSAFRAKLIVATVTDAAGAPVFTAADVEALQGRCHEVIKRLSQIALRLNRMRPEDTVSFEKNSEATGSGSPSA